MSDEKTQEEILDGLLLNAQERTLEVLDDIELFTKLDTDNLDIAMMAAPKNMSKLQRLYHVEGAQLKKNQDALKSMRHSRWKFYAGKAPNAYYRKNPLDEVVLKTDLPQYIDSDPLVQKMNLIVVESETRIKAIEAGIGMLKTRGYDIRTIYEYKRFTSGT